MIDMHAVTICSWPHRPGVYSISFSVHDEDGERHQLLRGQWTEFPTEELKSFLESGQVLKYPREVKNGHDT